MGSSYDMLINGEVEELCMSFFGNNEEETETNKFTYKESFNFIPKIEIKFSQINEINQELIDDLLSKLKQLFNGKDVKIIEMKKGSLDIAIALNYLIQEGLDNLNIHNITVDELLNKLNEHLNIKTKNIKNMIQDNLIIGQKDKQFKPDFVNENLLDLTKDESKELLSQNIKEHFQKKNEQFNVFEAGKNITPEDIKSFFNKLFEETKIQQNDLCDIILNNSFQEYLQYFESEFEKSLQNSIFEYNTKYIAYIYRNDEQYKSGKLHCRNLQKRILFHGTKSKAISNILAGHFRHANVHIFGIGVYFTDLIDYAWYYGSESDTNNRANFSGIPKIKDSFSFIASEIYYDKSKFEQVYDNKKINDEVPKNGIRHACVGYDSAVISKNKLKNYKGFIGTEYLITNWDQILPLLNVTVERAEFLIVWRDNNFQISNPNGYSEFQNMYDFNHRIKKYASFNLKTKIYYFNQSNEALNFIKRKIYNKIILISNGGNDGIGFINEARKIIGSNTISIITCYVAENYMDIVQKNENTLINSKHYECMKEFLDYSTSKNINALRNLQKNIETNLKNLNNSFHFRPINNNAFHFPKFKEIGTFENINFD